MKAATGIACFFFLLLHVPSFSWGQVHDGWDLGTPRLKFGFEPHSVQNQDEWLIGGDLGVADSRNHLTFTAFFDGRPYLEKTFLQRGEVLYQFHEWRAMAGFKLEKAFFPLIRGNIGYGFYLEGVAGYAFGNYRGSSILPSEGWTMFPGAGLALFGSSKAGYLKLGLQRAPIPGEDIEPLRYKLAWLFYIISD